MENNPELIHRFITAAERTDATVQRIQTSPEALKKELQRVTLGFKNIVIAEPDDLAPELFDSFLFSTTVIRHPSETQLVSADIGISDTFAGVARTGSICVSITRGLAGAVSLFPKMHCAVLEAKNIVARPRDVFNPEYLDGKGLQRNFVFITGPSATADMGSLVKGVHGPEKLHIILMD